MDPFSRIDLLTFGRKLRHCNEAGALFFAIFDGLTQNLRVVNMVAQSKIGNGIANQTLIEQWLKLVPAKIQVTANSIMAAKGRH